MTKKRRIQPIPVDEEEELALQLPVPAFSAQPSDSTRIVDPPEPGRRMWISLENGYDFNYKKIVAQKGVKPASKAKQPAQPAGPVLPAMPGIAGPSQMRDGQPEERGSHMQKALQRIERRVQRERMVAVTGNNEADSDEDMDDAAAEDGEGAEQDGEDGKDENDKDDGEEEQEYEQTRGPKDQYDLNDDFIDDSEFIEAIQMRDERKLKHEGFFVNSGAVERIGERVPVIAAVRPRKKKRVDSAEGEAGASEKPPAKAAKAATKSTKKATNKAAKAASEDPPPSKRSRQEASAGSMSPTPPQSSTATGADGQSAPMMSIAAMAIAAGQSAAAGGAGVTEPVIGPLGAQTPLSAADQAAIAAVSEGQGVVNSGGPVGPPPGRGDIASPTPPANSAQLLSDRPPMLSAASTPSLQSRGAPGPVAHPSPLGSAPTSATQTPGRAAHTAPDASADAGQGLGTDHARAMLALPVEILPDNLVGLPDWDASPRFLELIRRLRDEAARTPPPASASKKKMPQALTNYLESLVRPFYISAEAAPNLNKAKRAMWALMMPFLTPWSAENTIKAKMQKFNTQAIGAYQLEKTKLENIAQWAASVSTEEGLNANRTLTHIRSFVDATAACDAISVTSDDAEKVWESAVETWNNAGGPQVNSQIVQSLYRRAMETPLAPDTAAASRDNATVAAVAAGALLPVTG